MKKFLFIALLMVGTLAANAQTVENLSAGYVNNHNGTITCTFTLQDRWPAGHLVGYDFWCSITLVEVEPNGTEHGLSFLSVPYPQGLFHTIDVVNTLVVNANTYAYTSASTSKFYVRLMHYYSISSGSSQYIVRDTYTAPRSAY
jgi:hypothetical protein